MIINYDRDPRYSLYFIGGRILNYLRNNSQCNIYDIHNYFRKKIDHNFPIGYVYYGIDLLYLIGSIELNDNNEVIKCK